MLGGAAFGYRRRVERCGACMVPLRRGEQPCGKCGARLGESRPYAARPRRTAASLDDDVDEALAREAPGNAGEEAPERSCQEATIRSP